MQHITYRPVDRQFRCIQADLPEGAPFNRVDPIGGITFGFALVSRYPEEIYFGTVDGKVVDNPAIGLRAITEAEFDAARAAEITPPPADMERLINEERDRRIAMPFSFEGQTYQADSVSRNRIDRARGSATAAVIGGAQPGDLRWTGEPLDFIWIALDNSRVPMDALTTIQLGNAAVASEGRLVLAANDLKRRVANGERLDVREDGLWP